LTYQTRYCEVPDGIKKDFEKSGFIHPITSPSGQVLSRIQPPDHYHHYGIWGPWTRATINGREVGFFGIWEMERGESDFGEVLSMKEAGGAAELNVRQNHLDLTAPESERLAIKRRTFASKLSLRIRGDTVSITLLLFKLQWMAESFWMTTAMVGGLVFGPQKFGEMILVRYLPQREMIVKLRMEPKQNGLLSKEISKAKEGKSGILFLSHNTNKVHPEPLRVWPVGQYEGKGNVFIEFCPIRHESWALLKDEKYTLKYRMIVFDGTLSASEAEAYWKAFVK